MQLSEIKEKKVSELYKELFNLKKDLVLELIQIKMGKIKSSSKKKYLKKTIARIKTVITQKLVEGERNEKA